MKILFLDDNLNRTKSFLSKVPSALTFETAESIINQIKKESITDVLFLDHDLGEEVFVNSNRKDCGMEVVRYIIKDKPNIKNIIVHSLNYPAAMEMVNKLNESGYKTHYFSFLSLMAQENLNEVLKYVVNS